jgi:hypothetical protein|tara:strand:- start:616 stop:894 length:279 start_codon:yes stop_codon:yes gene_type:complete
MSGQFHFEYTTDVPVYDRGTTVTTCTTGVSIEKDDPNQATLEIEINFDSTRTDAESIAVAFDQLLETVMSTPGILEDYGSVIVDAFYVRRKF